MNIVFWLAVVTLLILLWFLLAFLFRPVGRFFRSIWNGAISEINKTDDNKEEDEE